MNTVSEFHGGVLDRKITGRNNSQTPFNLFNRIYAIIFVIQHTIITAVWLFTL